jgi:flavin-dependent dehydrogenase
MDQETPMPYDVIILGGALAGGATGLLLRRRHPGLKVLIVERNPAFDWKVGESTVEVSAYFLTRVLRLYEYLSREQLPKHGLRYWFHNGKVASLRQASETGSGQLPRVPSFQLDRAKLDEHVQGLAREEGAQVLRPAKVLEVRLAEDTGREHSVVVVEHEGQVKELEAQWVVDASGRAAILSRKKGQLHLLADHPISAIWARYTQVKDMDGPGVAGLDPSDPWGRSYPSSRRLATNHFTGYGYWIWFIPLHGGQMSVGAVWDRRRVEPSGSSPRERLEWFLKGNPLSREMIEGARLVPDDLRMYAHLPYLVDRVAGVGWSLVGDAAGFLDPFYSPGIDQVAYSVSWTLELIERRRKAPSPEEFRREIDRHNESYARFFRFFFEAIYRDKYALMGDFDLMTASLLIDTCLYYYFNVMPAYRGGDPHLLNPPFYKNGAQLFKPLLGFHRRRLVAIAERKRRLGIYGNHNAGRRPKLIGFSLGWGTSLMFLKGLGFWLKAEVENAWATIARPRPLREGMPGPWGMPAPRASTPSLSPAAPEPPLDHDRRDALFAQESEGPPPRPREEPVRPRR